jgi:hypothetical protein
MDNINPQYIDDNGQIKMCQACRKVKSVKGELKWLLDTVLYVNPPKSVIFETCPDCLNTE